MPTDAGQFYGEYRRVTRLANNACSARSARCRVPPIQQQREAESIPLGSREKETVGVPSESFKRG